MSREPNWPSKLTVEEIAQSTSRAGRHAAGQEERDADQCWPVEADGWTAVARYCVHVYDHSKDTDGGFKWPHVTERVYTAFHTGAQNPGAAPFASLGTAEQLIWEAIARHCFGAITMDAEETGGITDGESSWRGWTRRQFAKRQGETVHG
jgi:hypothetical protein